MIHTWFPKTILVEENILLEKLSFYEKFIEKKLEEFGSSRHGVHYVQSSHASFDKFHTLPEMEDLVREICIRSQEYLRQIGYNDNTISQMKIKNMWANISHKGDYLFPHIHGESLLSGAFYVCCGDKDKIKFFNDLSETYLKQPDIPNEYSYQYCEYLCTPGNLLIFKSNLMHGTAAQQGDKKIVISFNIAP